MRFFALLSLLAVSASAHAAILDRLEASVNSTLILSSDVGRFRETLGLRKQLDPLFAGTTIAAKGTASSDADIVEFLINEKLIASQFPVNDTEVEQEINSIQANNHLDRTQLKTALSEQGYTFDDYFEMIRASISKRNLIERDIRTKVTISDDDVRNHYYNNYADAKANGPKEYQLKIITVSMKNYKTRGAAKAVADRALQELKKGESFEDVAKRVSDDSSAGTGGELGTLTEDQMTPAMREEIKKLKTGEMSPVFASGKGKSGAFFILKLVDAKAGDSDQFEKNKEDIRSHLVASEYQHQITLWLDRQKQTAFIHRAGEIATAGLPAVR